MDSRNQPDREIDRYREAATAALAQLEWIVGYLNKIGKREIAGTLDRNRKRIIENSGGPG
jgi:hypothetical protein